MGQNTPEVGFAFNAEGGLTVQDAVKQLREELKRLKATQDSVNDSSKGAADGFRGLGSSASATTIQLHQARAEMMLVGETVGVRLPRELRTFAAGLPGVARLLSSVFAVTALGFFIDLITELPDKIRSIANSLVGWGDKAHKAYEEQRKLNDLYVDANEALEKAKRHASEAGLEGAAKTRQEIKNASGDLTQLNRRIDELGHAKSKLDERLGTHKEDTGAVDEYGRRIGSTADTVPNEPTLTSAERAGIESQVRELDVKIKNLKHEANELSQVGKPRLQADLGKEQLRETIELGKQKIEGQAATETQGAQLALQRQRAEQKNREEQDKLDYDSGLITLATYYQRRADEVRTGVRNEQAAITAERTARQSELTKLQKLPVGPTPQDKAARAREEQALQQQINALNERYYEVGLAEQTALNKLKDDERKAEIAHQVKMLEIQQKLAEAQGNAVLANRLKSQVEDLQTRASQLQSGLSPAQADQYAAALSAAREIRTNATAAKEQLESSLAKLQTYKSQLQEQVAAGEMSPYEAARKLRDMYAQQLPLLQAQVEALREQARAAQAAADANFHATGQQGPTPNAEASGIGKEADQGEGSIIRMGAEITRQDASWMQWKTTAKSAIDEVSMQMTTGLNSWMEGHKHFGQAVAQTWNSMVMTGVRALEQIAAHWIATEVKKLLIHVTTNAAITASDSSSQATRAAIESAAGTKSVFKSAKVAAAKAYKSAQDLPPPLNTIVGAIEAAAVFAAVMAFGAMAGGGLVGDSMRPRFLGFAPGGRIVARSMLGGGGISGPGTGTSDSIPIMASHGEYMMRAAATSRIGASTLDSLNAHPEQWDAIQRGAFLPALTQAPALGAGGLRGPGEVTPAGPSGPSFSHTTQIASLSALDGASVRAALEEHGDLIGKIAVNEVRQYFRNGGTMGS